MKEFYVYHHVRKSDGRVFYVGKGKGRRMFAANGRNSKWRNFVAKYGDWYPVVIAAGLSESEAHKIEMDEISMIGRENLCNLTDGGDGVSGYKFTPEQREKLSISHVGVQAGKKHPLYGKEKKSETREKISASLKGNKNRGNTPLSDDAKQAISRALTGMFSGEKHHAYDDTIRVFQHSEHGIFIGTTFQLRSKFGLRQGNICSVVRGKRTHCGGWVYLGVHDA